MLRFQMAAIRTNFYVKNIKMCIHPQGVRISTFFKYYLRYRAILLVLSDLCYDLKWTLKQLSLKSEDILRPEAAFAIACLGIPSFLNINM